MGGEPLCPENLSITSLIISEVKYRYPEIEIYLWTGYKLEEIKSFLRIHDVDEEGKDMRNILNNLTCLIDGRYEEDKRDITLPLRGSSNQNIYYFDKEKFL